ncbi:MAG: nucleoside-diphosphate sugar epimerase/dehydratase [Thermodesulfobacteriota bacterium]|nr:nucleoside-diphosphate sugar epimerase/dehydratase [Thermodesulfobacteriota bacterium]
MTEHPLVKNILQKPTLVRTLFFLTSDALIFILAICISFLLRFDFAIPKAYIFQLYLCIPLFITIKLSILAFFQVYRFNWAYIGLYELTKIFKAQTLSSIILSSLILAISYEEIFHGFPRSILLIDYSLSLILIGGLRISKRVYMQNGNYSNIGKKNTLIIGAGNAGEQIVRDMKRVKESPYLPVAFIDDDPSKKKASIHSVEVMGKRAHIPSVSKKLNVEMAVIAMPSVPSREIRDIVSYIRKAGIDDIHIIPSTKDIITRNINIFDIKKIDLEDLLGREPIKIEYTKVGMDIKGKEVLITGAGGSIGSELARQISRFNPRLLILLDIDETALFHIQRETKNHYPLLSIHPVLGDILDKEKMEAVFNNFKPQIVFHAAAYKHVPILEDFPEEAFKVNIMGTRILSELSYKKGVKKFVFISTDKAVNPTSIMGKSKRVAEMVVSSLNHQQKTQFLAVRFGNVLGSRGSVIPLFQEQIEKGGPVTITHPDMKRYFMTIPEAVLLVLQAGTMGKGGDLFLLDMGEQIKVYDVACELIRLSGLEPEKDIPIVYTGIRPGEKFTEELLATDEEIEHTGHPKIFKIKTKEFYSKGDLYQKIEDLKRSVQLQDTPAIIRTFHNLTPANLDISPD